MPLLWPADPPLVNRAEHRVWNALKEQLGENDLLIANQHFTDHGRDYELDIAVVLDGAGVVVRRGQGRHGVERPRPVVAEDARRASARSTPSARR